VSKFSSNWYLSNQHSFILSNYVNSILLQPPVFHFHSCLTHSSFLVYHSPFTCVKTIKSQCENQWIYCALHLINLCIHILFTQLFKHEFLFFFIIYVLTHFPMLTILIGSIDPDQYPSFLNTPFKWLLWYHVFLNYLLFSCTFLCTLKDLSLMLCGLGIN
jgi:hypothetical protein